MSTSDLALIVLAFVAAGLVKGILGMGLPSVAMALLGLAFAPAQAAALIVIPALATNLWQFAAGPALAKVVRRFGTLILGGIIGVFVGIGILVGEAGRLATALLGAVLALYGVLGLLRVQFAVPPSAERWASPLVGVVTGVLTGATGIYVIPAVPYFAALRIERDELVQLMGFAFSTSTIALAVALYFAGAYRLDAAASSLVGLAAAFGGMFAGQRLRTRLDADVFRRWFYAGMVAIGAFMIYKATR